MSQNESSSLDANSFAVDLTNCDREPIHIPGMIQPHGVLLVLQEPELTIVQVSENCDRLLGRSAQTLLNQSLNELLLEGLSAIEDCLAGNFESVNPLKLSIEVGSDPQPFDGILHCYNETLILELEPTQIQQPPDFFGFYRLVRSTIGKLQQANTLSDLCHVIVREVQQLTGFDRVMIYRFDAEGSGQVIAEAADPELTPFLGLRYPPSDIPKQARTLYQLNRLRLIPDAQYEPVPLVPPLDPRDNCPTDLSLSVLRSVSPLHVEYLKNMGVSASMSISLLKNKRLWGLIACHHSSPRSVSYEIRTACEFLGQVMSMELAAKEDSEDSDYKMRLKSLQSNFLELISQHDTLIDGLTAAGEASIEFVNTTGVAICSAGEIHTFGMTPPEAALQDLLGWIKEQGEDNVFYTDSLPKIYPSAAAFQAIASGLLALTISRVHQTYVLWFRPEVVQTVEWGGDPNKPIEISDDGELRLTPRKSFALWQETVHQRSLPWKACEVEAVSELRSAIVGLVLRQADELAKTNIELERSNSELDAFAYIASHDLKEPLRGIHNYSNFLIEDYGNVLSDDGIEKLQTLVRLTQRMEDLINSLLHFSRLGRVELALQPTDLNQLVQPVLELFNISLNGASIAVRIPRPLPTVLCDRVQMNEVFTNLIGNAMKYNDRAEKWVEIGYLDPEGPPKSSIAPDTQPPQFVTLYVRDNGIGILDRHLDSIFRIFKRLHGPSKYGGGTGAGLTITRKIVERHGGKIWVESVRGEGSTFFFTVPI